jgi:hypothetical protein
MRRNDGDIIKGMAAGIVAGLVASAVMNQFQKLVGGLIAGEERSHGAQSLQRGSPEHGAARELQEAGIDREDDDAPERLASVIAKGVFDQELTEHEKNAAGTVLHYAYGTSMAAVYGAAAEIVPKVTTGAGLPYGALIWLGADEGVVPLLGLSKAPMEYPLSIHAYALASHLVYGLTTEAVRRTVRKAL